MMNGWNMDGSSWLWMTLMMGIAVLVVGLLVWPLARRETHQDQRAQNQNQNPETILARRFSNGEIDETEYRRRLQVLRESETTIK